MKKFILTTVLSLFIFSISLAQVINNFEIKFKIDGMQAEGVFALFYGEKDVATYEKIVLDKKRGEFAFRGYTPSVNIAGLGFIRDSRLYCAGKASNIWIVVYPGAKFTVTGSLEGKNYVDIYPTDGGENDMLAKLNEELMPLVYKSACAYVKLRREIGRLSKDEVKELEKEILEAEKEIDVVKRYFFKEYPNSIAALWTMEDMLIRNKIPVEELASYFKNVNDRKIRKSYFYRAVKDRIEGYTATAIGKKCPDIVSSNTIDGSTFKLKSLQGKYVIIDFWGTWCGPCCDGIPLMMAFRDKYKDKVELLGISNDRTFDRWRDYILKAEMNYPNILCGPGDQDFVAKFNVQGFPTKILLDPNGAILYREVGESKEFYSKMKEMIR